MYKESIRYYKIMKEYGDFNDANTKINDNRDISAAFQYMNHALIDYGILGVWEYLGDKDGIVGELGLLVPVLHIGRQVILIMLSEIILLI